jgi:hypothetical protein
MGLPHYLAIDRNPDNGCKIQASGCGKRGVMLQLKVVKTTTEETALQRQQQTVNVDVEYQQLQHGTQVCVDLVKAWSHTHRLVCGYSYFASVHTAKTLLQMGIRFIGVVKNSSRRFPMKFLSEIELRERGNRCGLAAKDADGVPRYLAYVFVYRDFRYFIATAMSLATGASINRRRWRQVMDVESNEDPERLFIE